MGGSVKRWTVGRIRPPPPPPMRPSVGLDVAWDDPLRDPTYLEWINLILDGIFTRRNRIPNKLVLPVEMYTAFEKEVLGEGRERIFEDRPIYDANWEPLQWELNTMYGTLKIEQTLEEEPEWIFDHG